MQVEVPRTSVGSNASLDASSQTQQIGDDVGNAELAFVEGKFRKALKLTNRVLENSTKESCSINRQSAQPVRLQTLPPTTQYNPSSQMEDQAFLVDVSAPITPIDQAAVVSLQSSYELQRRKTSTSLSVQENAEVFLNYYCGGSSRGMPLDVAVIWIQYCHATGFHHCALEMATELLHILLSSSGFEGNGKEACHELIWFVLSKALAYSANPDHVSDVLHHIQAASWTPFDWTFVVLSKPSQKSVSALLSRLDDLSNCRFADDSVTDCISQNRIHLRARLNDLERVGEQVSAVVGKGRPTDVGAMIPSPSPQSRINSWQIPRFGTQDWQKNLARRMTHLFRTRVIEPLRNNEEQWGNRGKVAFTAFVVYLAWKRRRRIRSATKSMGMVVMSPLIEIVEALLPQQDSSAN